MRKTKILATYGPAVSSRRRVAQLVAAGVNVFRINCAHGSTEDFLAAARTIRGGAKSSSYPVGVLMDIAGPKLRLSRFDGKLEIIPDMKIKLTTGVSDLDKNVIGVNYPQLISSLRKGDRVFIDDGQLEFGVVAASPNQATITAVNSGTLLPSKGINVPDSKLRIPTIGPKDRQDIRTAAKLKADYIAVSFVRSAEDIKEARRLVKKYGGHQRIIAKLEKKEAIDHLEEIIQEADGLMIARGDLGVELPPANLPPLQKRIIHIAHRYQKPVIVATQMLESMRFQPRATRAEINDVASAVFDFVDAVMLSAETASGQYPVESAATMAKVIESAESTGQRPPIEVSEHLVRTEFPHAIAESVANVTSACNTRAIFAFTTTGFTAQMISRLFPDQPIIALTSDKRVMSQLSLYRAVYAAHIRQPHSFDDMLQRVNAAAKKTTHLSRGDNVIITGGAPFGAHVPTNFMMFHQIGSR